ncbi:unnamed protein product [Clonostachys rosea]|uniref:Mid2 domain-containing protein n=1 Tax=Bionectria ochroleuca TaxID=29856 RepID=A0ABY6UDJ4_BIOOC|nr:unnamed protein product [Clonostachys rosea]
MVQSSAITTVVVFSGLAMAHPKVLPGQPLSVQSFAQFQGHSYRLMAELKKRLFDDTVSSAKSEMLVSLRRRGVNKTVVGAAVGGVLGGLFLIALAIGLFWFLRRRRSQHSPQDGEPETPPQEMSVRTPFMADAPSLSHGKHGVASEIPREATKQASSDAAESGARLTKSPEIDPRSLQESLQGIPTEYTTGLGLYQDNQAEPPRVELEGSSEFRDQVGSLRPQSRIKIGQRQFIAGFKRTMSFRQA